MKASELRTLAALLGDEFGWKRVPPEDAAKALEAAADEIDAGRNARLVQYRCALVSGNVDYYSNAGTLLKNRIEDDAHAMLAAERAPEVKP